MAAPTRIRAGGRKLRSIFCIVVIQTPPGRRIRSTGSKADRVFGCLAKENQLSEHEHTNALINETSPYLLQHAHNPVNWYPWGEEALHKARDEDKPILL